MLRAHVWHDVVFGNIIGTVAAFDGYNAELIMRWHEIEHPIYYGVADPPFGFTLNCDWKLAVENYCEFSHLPFVHPSLDSYSQLEDHYDIMNAPNCGGQGTILYASQISADGRKFTNFGGLSAKWENRAKHLALFPNMLLGIHQNRYFAIILTPVRPQKTIEQIELYYTSPEVRRSE